MSTRANIIIKDDFGSIYFYRHSDGYTECTGQDLKDFVRLYETGRIRSNAGQSAGWLILRGHKEYLEKNTLSTLEPQSSDRTGMSWKVGAYEPTTKLHSDVEFVYIIDLKRGVLESRSVNWGWDEKPSISKTTLIETVKINIG